MQPSGRGAGGTERRGWHNLREFAVLRALVETGKTTAAAHRLGLSQPAVSRALAGLEARLGRRLFARHGGRLVPMAEAVAISEELEGVFAALARIDDQALRPVRRGNLRLAAPPTMAHRFLPSRIAGFARAHPELEIVLDIVASDALVANVAESRVALGLTDSIPAHPGVRAEPLLETDAVCVLPRRHPLAARAAIEAPDLDGQPFVALTRRHSARVAIDRVLAAAGVSPNVVLETATSVTAAEFVREGLGLALLNPFPVAEQFGQGIVARPFRPRIRYSTAFILSSSAPVSASAAAFMAHVRASLDLGRVGDAPAEETIS